MKRLSLFVLLVQATTEFCFRAADDDFPFVCLYKAMFKDLDIRLPFFTFQCDVLCRLNVALTQLHPNSWAFLRAFETLCAELYITPTSSKLFHFYSIRLRSLDISPRSSKQVTLHLISIINHQSSYKYFNTDFFKVRSAPNKLAFFLNQEGMPKFPLYWTRNPCRVTDPYNKLSGCANHFLNSLLP